MPQIYCGCQAERSRALVVRPAALISGHILVHSSTVAILVAVAGFEPAIAEV